MDSTMDIETLSERLAAVASPQRLRILATLAAGPVHVSELARAVGMSRALLYMHLAKLEEAGYVTGHLELSPEGKALKVFTVQEFNLTLDVPTILAAAQHAAASD